MVAVLITCISLLVLLLVVPAGIILYRFWWTPLQLQHVFNSQGIKGPSYNFYHGSNKEAMHMRLQDTKNPMDLSHDIFPKVQPHLYAWTRLYGDVFLNWFGAQPQIIVTDPDMVREILSNKEGWYLKTKPRFYFKKLLGCGLLMSEGEKWMKLRKLANHAFHGDCLKDMFPAMVASVESMLEKWRDYAGQEIDVCKEYRLLTADVISQTAFGSSYMEGRAIFDLLGKLTVVISRNTYSIRNFVRTEDEIEADRLEKLLQDGIMKIVKKREDEVTTGRANGYGSDYLGSLLKAHHESDQKKRISSAEIIDECKTFYFGGQETTFSLLSWTTLLLATHTEWQEKARKEVLELFGQDNPNSDGIARLKTVSMILYETLRLYSPVIAFTRRTESQVKLGKYDLPPNVDIFIPPLAIHRNPNIWGQDAHLFKPERFADGLAKATDGNSAAFLSFGLGPRMCVGMNFAINEAKIALSMILQHYNLVLSEKYTHWPHIVLTIQPQQGVQILLRPLHEDGNK